MAFFSFVAAPSIFKVLPRETAGDVVGDIFPKYWLIGYVCGSLALVSIIAVAVSEGVFPLLRMLVICAMTGAVFYTGLVVGEEARAIKAQVRAERDEQARQALRERFREVHARSSTLNLSILAAGFVLVLLTAVNIGF